MPQNRLVSYEMMPEKLMTVAYQLAVSQVREKDLRAEITRLFPELDSRDRRDIEAAVHYLRYPDNEYFVGDEVRFFDLGRWKTGTVIEAEWEEEEILLRQHLVVRNEEADYYITNFDCME